MRKSHYAEKKSLGILIDIETFSARRNLPADRHRQGTSPNRSSQCRGLHWRFSGDVRSADWVGSDPGTAAYAN